MPFKKTGLFVYVCFQRGRFKYPFEGRTGTYWTGTVRKSSRSCGCFVGKRRQTQGSTFRAVVHTPHRQPTSGPVTNQVARSLDAGVRERERDCGAGCVPAWWRWMAQNASNANITPKCKMEKVRIIVRGNEFNEILPEGSSASRRFLVFLSFQGRHLRNLAVFSAGVGFVCETCTSALSDTLKRVPSYSLSPA